MGLFIKKKKTHYEEGWDKYSETWDEEIKKGRFKHLGDEWGDEALLMEIISGYVAPHVGPRTKLLEIGCGGGKFSQKLSDLCGKLICSDVSSKMIERTRARLDGRENVAYQKLNGYDLHQFKRGVFDFVFSFDTFVHIDMEDTYSYLSEIRRVLKPGGKGLLHFANLISPDGWLKFVDEVPSYRGKKEYYNRFRFLTWEIVERFFSDLGFEILDQRKEPWRDILVLFRKPS